MKRFLALAPLYPHYPMDNVGRWLRKQKYSMCGTKFNAVMLTTNEPIRDDVPMKFCGIDEFQLNAHYVCPAFKLKTPRIFKPMFSKWLVDMVNSFLDVMEKNIPDEISTICAKCGAHTFDRYFRNLEPPFEISICPCTSLDQLREFHFCVVPKKYADNPPDIHVFVRLVVVVSNERDAATAVVTNINLPIPQIDTHDEGFTDDFWNGHHVVWYGGNRLRVESIAKMEWREAFHARYEAKRKALQDKSGEEKKEEKKNNKKRRK